MQAPLAEPTSDPAQPTPLLVLDTNIVLDLLVFADPRTERLRQALHSTQARWWATPHMREELVRVLAYPHVHRLMQARERQAQEVLSAFDQTAQLVVDAVGKAPYTCKDPDDQVFIDLACHLAKHSGPRPVGLISKDKAVLSMRKRLERCAVIVKVTF